jgi:hypothetical protein
MVNQWQHETPEGLWITVLLVAAEGIALGCD